MVVHNLNEFTQLYEFNEETADLSCSAVSEILSDDFVLPFEEFHVLVSGNVVARNEEHEATVVLACILDVRLDLVRTRFFRHEGHLGRDHWNLLEISIQYQTYSKLYFQKS